MAEYTRQWEVESDTRANTWYKVSEKPDGNFECSCPAWIHAKGKKPDCKHILQIKLSDAQRQLSSVPERPEMIRQLSIWLSLPAAEIRQWDKEDIQQTYIAQKNSREVTIPEEDREETARRRHFQQRRSVLREAEEQLDRRVYENFIATQMRNGTSRSNAEAIWRRAEKTELRLMEFFNKNREWVISQEPANVAEYIRAMEHALANGFGAIHTERVAQNRISLKTEICIFWGRPRSWLVNEKDDGLQIYVNEMRAEAQRRVEHANARLQRRNSNIFNSTNPEEPAPEPLPQKKGRRIRKRDD